jgi:hypothetical protein
MQGDVGGPDIIQIAAAVNLEIGPDRQPQVAPAAAAPVLENQPRDGAALADTRA